MHGISLLLAFLNTNNEGEAGKTKMGQEKQTWRAFRDIICFVWHEGTQKKEGRRRNGRAKYCLRRRKRFPCIHGISLCACLFISVT